MRVISGRSKGILLKSPAGMNTRPTADRVKEAMFSIIQFKLPAADVLDLFAGTGQLGIEALSRGARNADFVDASKDACRVVSENIKKVGYESISGIYQSDYLTFLKNCRKKYDIIFLDPPYAEVFLENALKIIAEIDILHSGGIIMTERPLGKELSPDIVGYIRSRDYKYGQTLLTLYRKE